MTFVIHLSKFGNGSSSDDPRPYSVTALDGLRAHVVWNAHTSTKEQSTINRWCKENGIRYQYVQSSYHFDTESDLATFMMFWGGA